MLSRKKKDVCKREENRKRVNTLLLQELKEHPGRNFGKYFAEKGIQTIAVYGAGMVGEEVTRQLQKFIEVKYLIDKFDGRGKIGEIPILQFRFDFLPEVDAVIITPCHEVDFIMFQLRNYYTDDCQFLALDVLLEEVGDR